MELISKENAVTLIKAEMEKIRTHSLVDGTARLNLRLAKNIIEDMPTIDLADYVPRDFHDKTCEAMAKRHQEEIADILERADADRPQEWIPCNERLPKRQGYYICTCKDGSKYKRTTVVKWSNGWQLTGARAYWIVLAWMPLPKPWKGADDE